MSDQNTNQRNLAKGLTYGFGAYLIWGSFPLFISMLAFAPVSEVVGWRILWGFATAALLVTATRASPAVLKVLRNRALVVRLAIASLLILVNWEVYVLGVLSHQIVQSSLGYFINPLITVILAVVFLGERLRKAQWVAVGLGAAAVALLTTDYGHVPWIALALALSFGFYGLVKNQIADRVSPLVSFTLESLFVAPIAIGQIMLFAPNGQIAFGQEFWPSVGLAFFGVMTALPLIMFGAAAKHLPLSLVGFMQYLTPSIQFALALLVFHEPMSQVRWIGFALVWAGLAVLTIDMTQKVRSAVTPL